MASGARLSEAIRAAMRAGEGSSVEGVIASAEAWSALGWPDDAPVTRVPQKNLPRALADAEAPCCVLLTHRLPATLMRTLQSATPSLVIVTAQASDAERARLDTIAREGVAVLGPEARMEVGDGERALCAANAAELTGLMRASGTPRLAVSPTPPWWAEALECDLLRETIPVGYVPRQALRADWSRFARAREDRHALIPVGVPTPDLTPHAPSLDEVASAHALERLTGPVFPAPRVLHLLLHPPRGEANPSEDDLALWGQARRALPMTGGAPGMASPAHDVEFQVPTAAFLAQRARLRRAQALAAAEVSAEEEDLAAGTDVDRALEVLRAAGEALSEHESKVVLRGVGIRSTRQAVANSASGAVAFAERLGFPVVLKVVGPALRRKLESGMVLLDLGNAAAVRRGHARLMETADAHGLDSSGASGIDGVLVAEQVPVGLDLTCGMVRSASGAPIFFGQHRAPGVFSEPVTAAGPLGPRDAHLLAHAVLTRGAGVPARRATDPSDRALADFFARLDRLVRRTEGRLSLVEVAPLRVVGGDVVALDARIEQDPHIDGL